MERIGRTVAIAMVVVLALFAATAHSAWLAPQTIPNAGQDHGDLVTLGAADGTTTVVYARELPNAPLRRVELRRIGRDGAVGAPVTLAPDGDIDGVRAAMAADGSALVAWRDGDANAVKARRVSAAGVPVGVPATISGSEVAFAPELAGTPDGAAVVAWYTGDDSVQAVRLAPGSTSGTIRTLTLPTEEGYDPWVAMSSSDGVASVVWYARAKGSGDAYSVFHTTIGADGQAGDTKNPEPHPAQDNLFPRVARTASGAGALAWRRADDRLEVVTFTAAGEFNGPFLVADVEEERDYRLAARADGRVNLVWSRRVSSAPINSLIHMAVIDPAGGVLAPFEISAGPGEHRDPELVLGTDGVTTVAWIEDTFPQKAVRSARLTDGGTLSPLVTIAPLPRRADAPRLATLPGGEVAAAWLDDVVPTGAKSIEFTHFDRLGPVIATSSPVNGVAGQPVQFGAQVSDRARPVTVSWTFGDGAGATGAGPAHVYARAGAYTARVTAVDAVGNATSADVEVQVAATPAGPDPAGPPPAPDTTAPRLTGLSVTPARVRRGSTARTTRTTRIRFRLDEAARVRIAVERQLAGRRMGARCVAPTRALVARRARPCVRFVNVGVITRDARAGVNTVTLTRLRVGRRTLVPGRHRVRVQATDAAGNRSAIRTRPLIVLRAPAAR